MFQWATDQARLDLCCCSLVGGFARTEGCIDLVGGFARTNLALATPLLSISLLPSRILALMTFTRKNDRSKIKTNEHYARVPKFYQRFPFFIMALWPGMTVDPKASILLTFCAPHAVLGPSLSVGAFGAVHPRTVLYSLPNKSTLSIPGHHRGGKSIFFLTQQP